MTNPLHPIIGALLVGFLAALLHFRASGLIYAAAVTSITYLWVGRSKFASIRQDAPGGPMRLGELSTIGAVAAILVMQWLIAFALMSATYWPTRLLFWPS